MQTYLLRKRVYHYHVCYLIYLFAEAEGPISTNLTFSTEQNDILAAVSSSISIELQPNANSLQIQSTTGSEKGMG
jgi:hypothetical protein